MGREGRILYTGLEAKLTGDEEQTWTNRTKGNVLSDLKLIQHPSSSSQSIRGDQSEGAQQSAPFFDSRKSILMQSDKAEEEETKQVERFQAARTLKKDAYDALEKREMWEHKKVPIPIKMKSW